MKEERHAKMRKEEQKLRDTEEGKPHERLHDMKEALGIGYEVKKGPRSANMLRDYLRPGMMDGSNGHDISKRPNIQLLVAASLWMYDTNLQLLPTITNLRGGHIKQPVLNGSFQLSGGSRSDF
jgi:hypothetical protein